MRTSRLVDGDVWLLSRTVAWRKAEEDEARAATARTLARSQRPIARAVDDDEETELFIEEDEDEEDSPDDSEELRMLKVCPLVRLNR